MSCDPFPRLGREFAMMRMRVITCRGIGPRAAMGHLRRSTHPSLVDGLPSIAEGRHPAIRDWQQAPNYRTNLSSSRHGRNVPVSEIGQLCCSDETQFAGGAVVRDRSTSRHADVI